MLLIRNTRRELDKQPARCPTTRGHPDVIRRASVIVDELSLEPMEWFGANKSSFHIRDFTGLLVDCRSRGTRFNIRWLRAVLQGLPATWIVVPLDVPA